MTPTPADPSANAAAVALLPCPWCGEHHKMRPWHGGGSDKQLVSCWGDNCEVRPGVTGETPAEAIAAWNTRLATPTDPNANASAVAQCPTPWCVDGNAPYTWQEATHLYTVICASCQLEGPHRDTEAEAIAAWNQRPTPSPVPGLADELEEKVAKAIYDSEVPLFEGQAEKISEAILTALHQPDAVDAMREAAGQLIAKLRETERCYPMRGFCGVPNFREELDAFDAAIRAVKPSEVG